MDQSTSVGLPTSTTSVFQLCAPLLNSDEFLTSAVYFPRASCIPETSPRGFFRADARVYENGKLLCEINAPEVDEGGAIVFDFDSVARLVGRNVSGFIAFDYYHPVTVPIDPYVVHTHRATGCSVSHPAATHQGEILFQEALSSFLENTNFWPGIVSNQEYASQLLVLNPFKVSYSYQLSVFAAGELKLQSEPLRITPHRSQVVELEEVFPALLELTQQYPAEAFSLCVASQYHSPTLFGVRHRKDGYYTVLDHLHPYQIL